MKEVFDRTKERMEKSVTALHNHYVTMRSGRVSAAVLDKVKVDYYGTPTPVNQMAAISVAEGRIITIQPWDASTLNPIERAIHTSDLGVNPQNDGRVIRLTFPPLTEERRKELVKEVSHMAEEAKVAVRSIRRDSMEALKKMKKDSAITEDDLKSGEEEVQKITDSFVKKVDAVAAQKEKEIMEI